MRGKATRHIRSIDTVGITPAYAGKSGKSSVSRSSTKDHPRLCGEKPIHFPVAIGNLGSPPPMRGKGFAAGVLMPACGITPAYAGKRNGTRRNMSCCWDHPRLCGEKRSPQKLQQLCQGSPPPMRGKVQQVDHLLSNIRITPAYAGKRHSVSPFSFLWTGSPPPMRGKARCFLSLPAYHRITPAYAGKRLETASLIVRNQDHPRLCGEKAIALCSSPRGHRITPAYAGKSACGVASGRMPMDHPRLCGEKR